MRMTEQKVFGKTAITVKELTIAEIRAWLKKTEIEEEQPETVDLFILPDLQLQELLQFTDATPEDLDALTQSEVQELYQTVKEVNPLFFGMVKRLADMSRSALQPLSV